MKFPDVSKFSVLLPITTVTINTNLLLLQSCSPPLRCHLFQADAPKLSSPLLVGLCVWCVYVSVCVSTCTHMFTEARGGGCSQSMSINRSPSSALRQNPFTELRAHYFDETDWSESPRIILSKDMHQRSRFLHGCWGYELRSSSLHKSTLTKEPSPQLPLILVVGTLVHLAGPLCCKGAAMWVYKI